MKTIHVKTGRKGYDILLGQNILPQIGQKIRELGLGESIFVITSPRIAGHHLAPLLKSLRASGYTDIKVNKVPDGEKYKSLTSYKKLIDEVLEFNKDDNKKIFILNLGGGVVGDLGGFVASTYRRGTPYVQVPTTLLAFVDCGIGGKVGVNHNSTKNVVGQFHQPTLVYADLSLINTLNKRELRSALAEIVKYGVINSYELFEFLEENIQNIFALDADVINQVATQCYTMKADIVANDEFDQKNIRAVLNYGHTIGHAVEATSKYSYRHGEAVSIGIVCINDIAVQLGMLDKNVAARIENLLIKIGLPVDIKNCGIKDIMRHFWSDKKFVNGINKLIIATDIGKTEIVEDVAVKIIESAIKKRFHKK